jgi:hypothetical protein
MPSNRIITDTGTKQLAKMGAIATDRLLDSLAEMKRIKLILDSASTGADWASVAAELGLVDKAGYTALQQALDYWTIFSNATARIDDPAVLELKRIDQG